MNFSELLKNLAFLSLFHVLGGIAIGGALRKLRQGISVIAIFFLFWGTVFGLAPLAMGVQIFQEAGAPLLAVVEVIVMASAVGTAFFVRSDFLEDLSSKNVSLIFWGSVFSAIGLATGIFIIRQNVFAGLLFLVAFGGSGLFMLISGIQQLLKEK